MNKATNKQQIPQIDDRQACLCTTYYWSNFLICETKKYLCILFYLLLNESHLIFVQFTMLIICKLYNNNISISQQFKKVMQTG